MKAAETQLDDVKNKSDKMTPEDRVTQTMDLLEDIHEKAWTEEVERECGETLIKV